MNDLELERWVIGCLLNWPEHQHQVFSIDPENFTGAFERAIFETAREQFKQGRFADELNVRAAMRQNDTWEQHGGYSAFAGIIKTPDEFRPVLLPQSLESLQTLLERRRTKQALLRANTLLNDGESLETLSNAFMGEMLKARSWRNDGGLVHISEAIKDGLLSLDMMQQNGGLLGISTGFAELDYLTRGIEPGEHYFIGADAPGVGKSFLALQISRHVAKTAPCIYVSGEMSKRKVGLRDIGARSGLDTDTLERAYHSEGHVARPEFERGWAESLESRLWIDHKSGHNIDRIRSRAMEMKAASGGVLGAIVVDMVNHLQGNPKAKTALERLESVLTGLKELSKELEAPVVSVVRANREDDMMTLPTMRGFGYGASQIESDAGWMLAIIRAEKYFTVATHTKGYDGPKDPKAFWAQFGYPDMNKPAYRVAALLKNRSSDRGEGWNNLFALKLLNSGMLQEIPKNKEDVF